MASMTGNDPTRSTSSEEEPVLPPRQEPDAPQQGEDPGYLTETGQAAGEDGSVAPIIGGLPAVGGAGWDIEIGRAACRGRGENSGGAASFKKKKTPASLTQRGNVRVHS